MEILYFSLKPRKARCRLCGKLIDAACILVKFNSIDKLFFHSHCFLDFQKIISDFDSFKAILADDKRFGYKLEAVKR